MRWLTAISLVAMALIALVAIGVFDRKPQPAPVALKPWRMPGAIHLDTIECNCFRTPLCSRPEDAPPCITDIEREKMRELRERGELLLRLGAKGPCN
jgi:hypothetical protein